MAKRPGSLMLTFSKKNIDIRNLLEDKKSEDEGFIVTDYICESIRFYEKYKNSAEFSDLGAVGKLIDERLKQFMKTNSTVTFGLAESQKIEEENMTVNTIKTNINTLESDLDNIPIDED
ncbi:hypothetical protein [Clostridium magnum]|uniref:Uncharacterized protein n=1 Tax=Clostridium magnum DSM 2767 TaxID=1121326 RepID=A0A161YEM0_9CLOT|nr:hypothetical protein [Clostridium magnum]KZL88422.1 hypothetical protein CLMAG_62820 [Clostridium magnum DSM 2767]SHJ26670.1 hypothetical protein SAMN02745944_05643 [Clostridium magnum DSM 2767]